MSCQYKNGIIFPAAQRFQATQFFCRHQKHRTTGCSSPIGDLPMQLVGILLIMYGINAGKHHIWFRHFLNGTPKSPVWLFSSFSNRRKQLIPARTGRIIQRICFVLWVSLEDELPLQNGIIFPQLSAFKLLKFLSDTRGTLFQDALCQLVIYLSG